MKLLGMFLGQVIGMAIVWIPVIYWMTHGGPERMFAKMWDKAEREKEEREQMIAGEE